MVWRTPEVLRRWSLPALRWIGLKQRPDLGEALAAYRRGDYPAALRALQPLAEAGDRDAQYLVGTLYQQGKAVPQDEAQAMWWFRKAAEREQPEAQFALGRAYDEGIVVPQDEDEAARWYEQAARHGHAQAQYLLGSMYMTGRGVPTDPVEAYAWLSAAQDKAPDPAQPAAEKQAELVKAMTPAQIQAARRRLAAIAAEIR